MPLVRPPVRRLDRRRPSPPVLQAFLPPARLRVPPPGRRAGLGEDELVVTRHELNELRDRLYVLAETIKDVERDLTDDDADDERRLLNVLLYAAKQATSP